MKIDIDALVTEPTERAYVRDIQRRIRTGRRQVLARVAGIQMTWVVVLVAGAAVTLVDVLGLPSQTAPVLGFVVVVLQGAEQIFSRTSAGFTPLDAHRRGLDRELRMFALGHAEYAGVDAPFALFTERCEALIADYNEADIEYYRTLSSPADAASGGTARRSAQ